MIRFFALLLGFFLVFDFADAQKISISPPFKLPARTEKIRVIGKNQDGYVIRLSASSEVFAVFNNDMKLSSVKTFELKNGDDFIQHVQLYKSGAAVYYLHGEKSFTLLLAQIVNSKFQEVGNPIVVDTLWDNIETANANMRMKQSIDQRFTAFYIPIFGSQTIESMQTVCVDKNASRVSKTYLPIHKSDRDLSFSKMVIDTFGNTMLLFNDGRNSIKAVLSERAVPGEIKTLSIPMQKSIFGEPYIEIDNKNNHLLIAGFYDDEITMSEAAAYGFFYKSYDYKTGITNDDRLVAFPDTFIQNLTGRQASESNNRLYTFTIRKVLQREDGGILISAESSFRDKRQEAVMPSMGMGYGMMGMGGGGYSYRTINIFQYNDIIAFSIDKNGNIDWSKVMHKKQYSEDDDGNSSSYFLSNQKDVLYFIFPEEISTNADADEYILQSNGNIDKRHLFSQEEKDVFLIPKLGKQTAKNETIIPSAKGGSLRLVRFVF
ncbi:MAG TPA: hypothetical protein VGB95_00415 [Chitinophagales bacterium]